VIDDVVLAIKPEFDEFGVTEDVLAELQHKWESKVIASRVAEFEAQAPQPAAPAAHPVTAAHHAYPPHPMHLHPHYAHNPYAAVPAPAPSNQPIVKSEPMDTRYMLNTVPYALPPLPGPINGSRQLPPLINPGGQTGVFSFKAAAPQPVARSYVPPAQPAQRIPQVDGPSESSGDEDSPSPPPSGAFAPRASHPSLPQPVAVAPKLPATNESEEAINSDLDDPDTEGEDEADEVASHDTDIVFCTYDKVARVKNKWKCTLKDGMIHINGKDYLFAKCTGEFEW